MIFNVCCRNNIDLGTNPKFKYNAMLVFLIDRNIYWIQLRNFDWQLIRLIVEDLADV